MSILFHTYQKKLRLNGTMQPAPRVLRRSFSHRSHTHLNNQRVGTRPLLSNRELERERERENQGEERETSRRQSRQKWHARYEMIVLHILELDPETRTDVSLAFLFSSSRDHLFCRATRARGEKTTRRDYVRLPFLLLIRASSLTFDSWTLPLSRFSRESSWPSLCPYVPFKRCIANLALGFLPRVNVLRKKATLLHRIKNRFFHFCFFWADSTKCSDKYYQDPVWSFPRSLQQNTRKSNLREGIDVSRRRCSCVYVDGGKCLVKPCKSNGRSSLTRHAWIYGQFSREQKSLEILLTNETCVARI